MFVLKGMMGIVPEMDIINMLSDMMGTSAAMGWVAHFVIGTVVWGGIFALANGVIPGGSQTGKGVVLGIVAWLMMMVVVMPMAGGGFFGSNFGMIGFAMPLVLHLIFGAVLGFVAAYLSEGEPKTA
ncbi:MAG: hypothetical protein GXP05_05945 [Alphaproteobacteria bacterium]|nr:hypothetical protein [Alphaproteobacteria bacterium]